MKLSVALFFAGLFGALAAVFILLSFGTDYWLLASETCHPNPDGSIGPGGVTIEVGVGLQTAAGQGGSEDSLIHLLCLFGLLVTPATKVRSVVVAVKLGTKNYPSDSIVLYSI